MLSKNCEKRLLALSCLSVLQFALMEKLGYFWADFHEICYLSTFWKIYRKKINFDYNLTRITGTLHEDL